MTRTERAEDVPETIAFADGKPVTRIVVIESGDQREIRSYGPDGDVPVGDVPDRGISVTTCAQGGRSVPGGW